MKKPILLAIVLIAVMFICCICVAITLSSNNSRESRKEVPTNIVEVDINSFIKEFDDNQIAAETKYENRYVEFTGYVTNVSEDLFGETYASIQPDNTDFNLKTRIQCYFKNKSDAIALKNGTQATLSGKVVEQIGVTIQVKNCLVKH